MYSSGHAQGQLLGRVVTAVADTPYQIFKADQLRTEITLMVVAQAPISGNVTADIVIFHDDSGNDVYDITTVLSAATIDKTTAGFNSEVFQAQHPGSGIMVAPGGSIAVQSSRTNETVFTVYGVTETRADKTTRR